MPRSRIGARIDARNNPRQPEGPVHDEAPAGPYMRKEAHTMMSGKKMSQGLIFAAMLTILFVSVLPAFAAMSPKQYWEKGSGYAENKLYIDAVQNFTQAIRTNKGEIGMEDVARIFNSRGIAYQGMNDLDKAIDDFSNALELDDKNPEFSLNRANAFLIRKQYERARDDFNRAIKLAPRNAAAYAGRAKANQEAGSPDMAIADYRKLLELEPRDVGAHYSIGLIYKSKHQDAKAIEVFNELLKIDPLYAAASYQNAGLFARAGKIDSACVWLEEAVANGYRDWDTLKNDSDFDAIRKTKCYHKIMSEK
jgi:tetratricopeptide (TPR) repeat protein